MNTKPMKMINNDNIQIIPHFQTDTQNKSLENLGDKINGDIFNFGLVVFYIFNYNAKDVPLDMYKPETYSNKSDKKPLKIYRNVLSRE